MAEKYNYLTWNGHPLVCRGNTMIYGNIADSHYIQFTVAGVDKIEDAAVSGTIQIALMQGMKVIKTAEREGMYNAMDIAEFWLADAMEE